MKMLNAFCDKCGFTLLDPGQFTAQLTDLTWGGKAVSQAGLDLGPVTDDRPYPWHTLRLNHLFRAMGSGREEVLPRMEWGFLFMSMTLVITLTAALCILSITRPRIAGTTILPSLLYFTCLGLGYIAVEILAIKRGGLLIAQPARTAAYVLAPFLLFSGIGSFTVSKAERWWFKGRWVYGIIPVGTVILYLLIPLLVPLHPAIQITLLMVLVFPLALVMGLPFPLGLRRVSRLRQVSVPWVWAVSGYSSAAGSALAGVLSVTAGHRSLVVAAAACYLSAGWLLGKLGKGFKV
jgi:hypothetical protein